MLQLDASRMEIVTIPYQPSLVPYRINEYLTYPSLLAPPLEYTSVSPSCTSLHTLRLPTECLQSLLPSLLDTFKDNTSCKKLLLAKRFVCHPSNGYNCSYLLLFPCVAATCQIITLPDFKQAHLAIMACTHDHNGTSASPNSSEEVESHHGTPATKLSPFSPDQVLEDLKHVNQGIVRARVPPPFVLARDQSNFGPNGKAGSFIAPGSQDPFLSVPTLSSNTQSSGDGSKLSPNASTFTPTSLIESVSSNGTPSSSTFQYPLSAPICATGIQGLDLLSLMSHSNNLRYGPIGKKNVLSGPSDTTISPTSLPAVSSFGSLVANVGSIKQGQFSTDVAKSRSLMAGPVSRATSAKEIENLLGVSFVDIRSL